MTDGLVEAFRNAVEVAICETESEYIIEPELALTILRAQGFAVVPVGRPRCELASGNTIDEIRANLSRELHATGDCVLVWMNEGDLIQIGFDAMIAAGDKP